MYLVNGPMLQWTLGRVLVRVWEPDYMETCFPGGLTCPALFVDDAQARTNAESWGYQPDEVWRMHLEHELTHTLLAQASGRPWSPVLYHVAGGWFVEDDKRAQEEAQVVAVQQTLNRLAPMVQAYRKASGR